MALPRLLRQRRSGAFMLEPSKLVCTRVLDAAQAAAPLPKFGLDNLGENRPVPGLTVIDDDETF